MRTVWSAGSSKYIDNMVHSFNEGVAQGIIRSMVFIEKKAKSRFIQGRNSDEFPPIPWPKKPPGPLTSRTGVLRESIKSGVGKDVGWLKTNVSYGVIHEETGINEEGKSIGLRPFLRPAFTETWEKTKATLAEDIVQEMTK